MSKGANINQINSHEETPLLYVIGGGEKNLELIKRMIDYGAQLDYESEDGENVLIKALFSGSPKLVDFLLEYSDVRDTIDHSINYIIQNKIDIPYMLYYLSKNRPDSTDIIIDYIRSEYLTQRFIRQAVEYNDLEAVLFIISHFNITFNKILYEDRNTLLSLAARYSSKEIAEIIYGKVKDEPAKPVGPSGPPSIMIIKKN